MGAEQGRPSYSVCGDLAVLAVAAHIFQVYSAPSDHLCVSAAGQNSASHQACGWRRYVHDSNNSLGRERGMFWFQWWSLVLRSFSSFSAVYQALYLDELTLSDLSEKIAVLYSISPQQITHIYQQHPNGIHILVSDEVRLLACRLLSRALDLWPSSKGLK